MHTALTLIGIVFCIGATLLFLAYLLGAYLNFSKIKAIRMDMFENIGREWISTINKKLGYSSQDALWRNPHGKILERFDKASGMWIIAFPTRKRLHEDFVLLLLIDVSSPTPQVKTICHGIIRIRDPKEWWVPKNNPAILPEIFEPMRSEGLLFDIANPA